MAALAYVGTPHVPALLNPVWRILTEALVILASLARDLVAHVGAVM